MDPDECRCAVGRFDEHDGDLVVVGHLTVGQWRGGMIGQGGLRSRLGPGERLRLQRMPGASAPQDGQKPDLIKIITQQEKRSGIAL